MPKKPRPGAVRKSKKGPKVGTGGHSRKSLEGRGPTPKAVDREYHPAGKRAAAAAKSAGKTTGKPGARDTRRPGPGGSRGSRKTTSVEVVAGRNAVVEALREGIPATALYVAHQIDADDRVKEAISIAGAKGIALLEASKIDLDRLTDGYFHQGLALQVPAYKYAHPEDLVARALKAGEVPLIVALDGITDPRNLGAIIRSTAAFGGHGVVVPERRAASVTASAWKTSAGAAARIPVAKAANLTRTLQAYKSQGLFVLGLDMAGDVELPSLELGREPVVIVVGSEGKGLGRLVRETCDQIVSIPIAATTESLNAGIAAGVTLYEVARSRA
ncbi:23S rRNA (guanosine(2251)-2'-O)-methyltransferase RlmB [Saxibacter everestensis]|uniref:23S rRNA (Guanosine(2251)-2'-O)-methyltransferase RlmB n=1 Tax=Saxibacter everestensis TaxID=2909229 RepID=A0ABY8QUA1_9MICO|nr:23S rRNA (guanosine(2251)-2'-O)-methyltransferase RlmB [Brevibacteriaceae bacterium ZFBP1038]